MLGLTQLGTLLLFHFFSFREAEAYKLLLKHQDQDIIIFSPATSGISRGWGGIGVALAEPISGRSLPLLEQREKQPEREEQEPRSALRDSSSVPALLH